MNCDQVRSRLGEYLDGEVRDPQRQEIAAHLDRCAACAAELEQLRELARALNAPTNAPVPSEALWASIARRLDQPAVSGARRGASGRRRRWRWLLRRPLATAASLLITVGLGWLVVTAPWEAPAGASQIDFRPLLEQADGDIDAGIQSLLKTYGGEPITPEQAAARMRVRVHGPRELPGRLQLRGLYMLNMGGHHQALAFWYVGPRGRLLLLQCPPHTRKHYGNRQCVACRVGSHGGHIVRAGKLRLMHLESEHVCVCVVSTLDEQRDLPAALDAVKIDF